MTTVLAGAKLTEREINALMSHYEGLVFRTAQLLVTGEHPDCHNRPVEQEEDDVRQVLRMKVFYALKRYEPAKVVKRDTSTRERYGSRRPADKARDRWVNMCVRDCAKDVAKRKRRDLLLIEDVAPETSHGQFGSGGHGGQRDKFEAKYLAKDHAAEFAEVEDEFPTVPNTLSQRERDVMGLMYDGHKQVEIVGILEISKREVESAVRGIRAKLADWKPTGSGPDGVGVELSEQLA